MSILNQIIAYSPNKIDTETKVRSLVQGPRNMYAGGQLVSQLVTPNPDGSRPGYAPVKGWKEEKAKFFKWLADNPDYDFASSSTPEIIKKSGTKFEVGTIQKFLNEKGIQTKHSIARQQEKPKYTKKVLTELRKGLPKGISIEETRPESGKYYYKIMLKGGKANKPTYRKSMVANEANKKLIIEDFNRVSKEYYPGRITDEEFKTLRLKNKDMTTEQFAKFLDDEGKTTYLGDKWNKSSVSNIQNRLDIGKGTTGPLTIRTVDEAKKIIRQQPGAKFFFMTNPTDSQITQYASNLVSQEKLGGKGGLRGFPIGNTKENKMFRNFYDSSLKSDGRMKLLTDVPKDADGNIDWKMKDKNGVAEWKKAKFYDNKTGATYTWGKDYKPGNLRKQVDKAYGKGFFAKSVQVYDEQAKMNKMKFNGKSLNEWMREGLLKKEFELKFNRKPTPTELKEWYALRKPSFSFTEAHHVEGVGKNPFRMEVSYRAANRKQNDLLNKYKSGTLNKTEYITEMENLSDTKGGIRYKTDGRFIGQTGTSENIISAAGKDAGFSKKQINNMMLEFAGTITDKCKVGNAEGGRIGFASGSADCLKIAKEGMDEGLSTGKWKSPDQAKMARNIAETAGKISKTGIGARVMAELFGPVAIASLPVFEAGIAGYDTITSGTPFNEAINKTLLHYALGDKTKADPEKLKQADILKMSDGPEKEMLIGLYSNIGNLNRVMNNYKQKAGLEQDKELYETVDIMGYGDKGASATQAQKQIDEINKKILEDRAQGKDYMTLSRAVDDPYAKGLAESKEGELLAKRDANSLSSRLFGTTNPYYFSSNYSGEVDPKRIEEMKAKNIGMGDSQLYSRNQIVDFLKTVPDMEVTDETVDFLQTKLNADYFRNVLNQPGMLGTQYSEGGIASLNVKK
jgi:hypothetical protein